MIRTDIWESVLFGIDFCESIIIEVDLSRVKFDQNRFIRVDSDGNRFLRVDFDRNRFLRVGILTVTDFLGVGFDRFHESFWSKSSTFRSRFRLK